MFPKESNFKLSGSQVMIIPPLILTDPFLSIVGSQSLFSSFDSPCQDKGSP